MATVTDYTRQGGNPYSVRYVSEPASVSADTVEITGLDPDFPYVYIGVQLLDSAGDFLDAATGGTFALTVQTWNTNRWEAPASGASIDATGATTSTAVGTLTGVRVVPSTVAGNDATSFVVYVSAYQH